MNTASLVQAHTRNYVISGALSILAFGIALALPASPARIDMMLWGLYLPLLATALSRILPLDTEFLCNSEPKPFAPGPSGCAFGMVLLAVFALGNPITMILMTVFDLPPNTVDTNAPGQPPINASAVMAAAVLFQGIAIFVYNLGTETTRLIRRVVDAPWVEEGRSPDQVTRMVGTVEDPTPITIEERPAAFAMVTDTEEVPGSDPNIVVKKLENVGTFIVRSGNTWVEIDPRRIHWSGPSKRTVRTLAPSGNNRVISTDYLPVGAKVLVVGKLRPQQSSIYRGVPYTLSATYDDPVMVLRTDDPEEFLRALRTSLTLRSLALIITAVFVLTAVVVSVVGIPPLPALHLPVGDGSSD